MIEFKITEEKKILIRGEHDNELFSCETKEDAEKALIILDSLLKRCVAQSMKNTEITILSSLIFSGIDLIDEDIIHLERTLIGGVAVPACGKMSSVDSVSKNVNEVNCERCLGVKNDPYCPNCGTRKEDLDRKFPENDSKLICPICELEIVLDDYKNRLGDSDGRNNNTSEF
jgi:hypothetical protein